MTRVVFDNTDLSEFGYTFHKDIDEVPEHDYEEVTILGKNGTLLIDNKRMKNVPESYDIAITDNSTADLDKLRNFLASKVGFKRLEDDIRPDRFVMAKFDGMNSRLPSDRSKATATMDFERKPERWLKSGETPVSTSSEDVTYTGNPVTIDNPSGIGTVGSLSVALNPIQNLNGYDSPWVGGAGKNMLPTGSFTISGGGTTTATFATDGVHISGTKANGMWADYLVTNGGTLKANTSYVLSLGVTNTSVPWSLTLRNGGTQLYEVIANNGSGTLTITPTADVTFDRWRLTIRSNDALAVNSVVKPMLRLSSTTATYEPYENVCPIYASNGKNLLPPSTTQTSNGVKFTVNDDGTITVTRTASSTENAEYDLTVPSSLYGKTVTLNGCPSGGSDSGTYRMFFLVNGSRQATDYGNGVTYTIPSSPTSCVVRINVFKDFNSTATFKPMIRDASITDATYVPYQGIAVQQTGKNLLDTFGRTFNASSETVNTIRTEGSTATFQGDSIVTVTNGPWSKLRYKVEGLTKGQTYTLSAYIKNPSKNSVGVAVSNGTSWVKQNIAKYDETTVSMNFAYDDSFSALVVAVVTNNSGSATNATVIVSNVQLELGSTATEYEPYTTASYLSSLGRYVYGGTVDLVTGVLTVTHVYGETTWGAMSDASTVGTMVRKRYSLGTTLSSRAGGSSNVAPYNSVAGDFDVDKGTRWFNDAANTFFYLPPSTPSTTLIQMVAQLSTPQTVQLTAQQISLLTGINYISSSDEVTVTVSEPSLLENPTLFESKPLIRVYGSGLLAVNNQYITVATNPFPYIDIDCDMMDCYYDGNNANQYVSFSTNDYVVLKSGNNYIAYSGTCKITPRWYEI